MVIREFVIISIFYFGMEVKNADLRVREKWINLCMQRTARETKVSLLGFRGCYDRDFAGSPRIYLSTYVDAYVFMYIHS